MENETRDFMKVESFSQLPFIRPSPLKEKSIRLFGKEFVGGADSPSTVDATDESDLTDAPVTVPEESKLFEESNRRFECHYCCRNFPTSQALGGHQNAHKRERQHAKRANLHSVMFNGSLTEMYGLMNTYQHHRQNIIPSFHHYQQQLQPPPSWGTTYNAYGTTSSNVNVNIPKYVSSSRSSYGFHQTPINGRPLATWSLSTATRNETGSNNPQIRYPYEQKSSHVSDQVSLDLSL